MPSRSHLDGKVNCTLTPVVNARIFASYALGLAGRSAERDFVDVGRGPIKVSEQTAALAAISSSTGSRITARSSKPGMKAGGSKTEPDP